MDMLNYDICDTSDNNFTIYARTGISQQPGDNIFCAGGTAVFAVVASGKNLRYQWKRNNIDVMNATLPTLYLNNAQKSMEGEYRCLVKGLCDSVLSDMARLIIKDSPKIIRDPWGDTLCMGSSITLSVNATGVGLNFAWNLNGRHIPGSNTSELQLNNVTKADSGSYRCIVSGTCHPKDTSKAAYVVVYEYPRISEMPQSQTVTEGNDVIFTVTATGDGLYYQWRKDGTDIKDSTNNTLTLHSVSKQDSGTYVCMIRNKCGQLITKDAVLKVIETEKPVIELTINSVDFGNTDIGKTRDTLLANVIHNKSQVPLTINSIKIIGPDAGDFNVFGISFPITIPAGQYRHMNIEFVPASLGVKTATITFHTNAANIVSISLIGYGIEVSNDLLVNDWDFGDVLIGSTNHISHNIIKNISNDVVTIDMPVVVSYDSLNFRLLDEEDYPKSINSGDSAEINYMFVPTIPKTYEVQVLVKNSSPGDLFFKLKGRGLLTDVPVISNNPEITIYPNPTIDYCVFDIHSVKDVVSITVTDIFGNEVARSDNIRNLFRWNLHTSDNTKCSAGLYFVKIRIKNRIYVKKLIIL
jgi:hypothetical protein